jgi:hypothetical protein
MRRLDVRGVWTGLDRSAATHAQRRLSLLSAQPASTHTHNHTPRDPAALRALTGDDVFWRDLALRKWGHRVDELRAAALAAGPSSAGAMEPASSAAALEPSGPPAAEPAGPSAEATATTRASSSWKQYAVRRMNLRAIRQSPLALGQEQYPDPWAHILCCVLCRCGSDNHESFRVRNETDRRGVFLCIYFLLLYPPNVLIHATNQPNRQPKQPTQPSAAPRAPTSSATPSPASSRPSPPPLPPWKLPTPRSPTSSTPWACSPTGCARSAP